MIRAKFVLNKVEITLHQRSIPPLTPGDPYKTEFKEMRTLILSPVYSNEEGSENKRFWDASPSGEIRLGTVNPSAWEQFELGKEYYVDFTKAEEPKS
jgi:hypothetical protein